MTTAPDGGELTEADHLWLRDVARHPDGEVRLYVGGRLVSGTYARQVTASIARLAARSTAPDTEAIAAALESAADEMPIARGVGGHIYSERVLRDRDRGRTEAAHWLRDRAAAIREGSDT